MNSVKDEIVELQMKISFQDGLMEELNQVIIDQQKQISRIELALETMKVQVNTIQSGSHESGPQHELPPHY
jgi:SlyX protein